MSYVVKPKNIQILIIDDEPEVHALLGKMLSRETYNLSFAHDADEAFGAIEKTKPDLIILDIMMPKISGFDICKKIKNDPKTRDVLVLMISARETQHDRIEGLESGADDYVAKPFHIRSLLRKIEHMLIKRREELFLNHLY